MNINPAKLQQIQLQEIETQLTAPNEFGTNKFLINVNGGSSKIKTNKNAIIKYTLEHPIKLEVGDKITLIDSFVEERGLAQDTISFETDVEEELRFMYYIQGDCRNSMNIAGDDPLIGIGADQEFTTFPNLYPDFIKPMTSYGASYTGTYLNTWPSGVQNLAPLFPNKNYITGSNDTTTSGTTGNYTTVGANGQYYYCCEWFNPNRGEWSTGTTDEIVRDEGQHGHQCFMRPLYGSTTIKVPAGNYSVSALAKLINDQLNGASVADKQNTDVLTNKLFNTQNTTGSQLTNPFFNNLTTISDFYGDIPISQYNPDSLIIGEDTYHEYQRRRGGVVVNLMMNSDETSNKVNMDIMRPQASYTPKSTPPVPFEWANGTSMYGNTGGYPTRAPYRCDELTANGNPTIYNSDSPANIKFRANATNFFLHLDGFRYMFDSNDKEVYNSTPIGAMGLGQWVPQKFPSLSDLFLQNFGDDGLMYFNQNLANLSDKYDHGHDGNLNVYQNIYPENLKFQCMFPINGSGDTNDPTTFKPKIYKGLVQQYAGTSAIELKYDTDNANRFSLLNLHEPYKLPSRNPDNKSATNVGGQQATIYNSPIEIDDFGGVSAVGEQYAGQYPIDSVGGIAINNFSFGSVKDTKEYNYLIDNIKLYNTSNSSHQMYREKLIFDLFSKPYDKFFDNEDSARTAWSNTLWGRLGFNYDQMGNISDNLESIYTFTNPISVGGGDANMIPKKPRYVKQMGIITHNAFDYSFIPATSGLGIGNPYAGSSTSQNPQNYGLRAYNFGANTKSLGGKGISQNYLNVLANSQPITANEFPSLNNGNNYLLIESDIVKTNAKDSHSNETTIVGVISKEQSTNDTLYSAEPITFIITEPRLLSTIEVKIKNPDGSLASESVIGKNSGFLFQIEKAIAPANIPLQSL